MSDNPNNNPPQNPNYPLPSNWQDWAARGWFKKYPDYARYGGTPFGRNVGSHVNQDLRRQRIEQAQREFVERVQPQTPMVRFTGGYGLPGDFTDTPSYKGGFEQLTPAERNFTQTVGNASDSWMFQKLSPVASWIGEKFQFLDFAAEGVERVGGFLYQSAFDPQLRDDFKEWLRVKPFATGQEKVSRQEVADRIAAAWEAGHITWDALGAPRLGVRNTLDYLIGGLPDPVEGALNVLIPFTGAYGDNLLINRGEGRNTEHFRQEYERVFNIQMDHWSNVFQGEETSTGGLPKIIQYREAIAAGADPEEAFQAYYEELGPLAARAQWADMFGHIALDPLNYTGALGFPKVTEAFQFAKVTLRNARIAPELSLAADDMLRVAQVATGALDPIDLTIKYGDEILDAAGGLTDVGRTRIADDLLELAAQANLEDFSGPATRLASAIRAGEDATEAAQQLSTAVSKLEELNRMSTMEQFFYRVLGGDPFEARPDRIFRNADLKVTDKFRHISKNLLTPRSRATMFVQQMSDNIRVVMGNGDDPVQWVRVLKNAAGGSLGETFGHMIVSPVGRHVQGVLRAWGNRADELLQAWIASSQSRSFAEAIARYTDTDIVDIVGRLGNADADVRAVMDLFTDALRNSDDAWAKNTLRLIEEGAIDQKYFAGIGQTFKPTKAGQLIPFTPDMFRAQALYEIAETAGKAAIAQFGVKQAGVVERFVDTIKAAEGLLLLGLNPKYPVQNLLNNEITMLARGVWSGMSLDDARNVFRDFGFTPIRAGEDFTLSHLAGGFSRGKGSLEDLLRSGSLEPARKEAVQVILDYVKGDQSGKLNRATELFRGITRGKDMRAVASWVEKLSSERATAQGMLKAWNEYIWKPNVGFTHMDDVIPGLAERLRVADPEYADFIYDVIQTAKKPEDLARITELADIRLNAQTMFREAAEASGMSVDEARLFMDNELMENFQRKLTALGDQPTADGIRQVIDETKELAQRSMDDMFLETLPARMQEFAARTQAEGPAGVMKIYQDVVDKIYERHTQHLAYTERLAREIRSAPEALRGNLWEGYRAETARAWSRTQRYIDTASEGIAEGIRGWEQANETGTRLADNYAAITRQYQEANSAFFAFKDQQYKDFFKWAKGKSFEETNPRWLEMQEAMDRRYDDLIASSDLYWRQQDEMFLGLLEGGDMQVNDAIYEWRRLLRSMRVGDMQEVSAFQKTLRGAQDTSAAWKAFNESRKANYLKPILEFERMGQEILNGNQAVIDQFLMLGSVADDYMDIRIVDLMSSSMDPIDLVPALERLPGGRKLIAELEASGNFRQAFEQMRGQYQVEAYDRIVRQMDAIYPPGSPEHQAAVTRLADRFGISTATEEGLRNERQLVNDVNAWWRGEYTRPTTPRQAAPQRRTTAGRTGTQVSGVTFDAVTGNRSRNIQIVEDALPDEADRFKELFDALDDLDPEFRNLDDGDLDGYSLLMQRRRPIADELNDILERAQTAGRVSGPPVAPREVAGPAQVGKVPAEQLDPYLKQFYDEALEQAFREIESAIETGGMRQVIAESKAHLYDPDEVRRFNELRLKPGETAPDEFANIYSEPGTIVTRSINPPIYRENYAQFGIAKDQLLNGLRRLSGGLPFRSADDAKNVAAAADMVNNLIWELSRGDDALRQYLMETPEWFTQYGNQYRSLDEIPFSEVARALRDRAVSRRQNIPSGLFSDTLGNMDIPRQGISEFFLNDLGRIVPRQNFMVDGLDDLWMSETGMFFEKMRTSAQNMMDTRGLKYSDIPADIRGDVDKYLKHVSGQMNDARLMASDMGQAFRDSALLNYNRQYHWDHALGFFAPFAYWYTHSLWSWAVHSLDRPAMLASFYKMYMFMNQAVGENSNMPSRLRGRIRVNLPFVPPEMGSLYVDPFRSIGLPFLGFVDAPSRWSESQQSNQQAAERKLQSLVDGGQITPRQMQEALQQQSGPVWDRAMALAQDDDSYNRFDVLDFMNLTTSPHLPLQWALNAARGTPQEGFGVLPMTRTVKNILGAFDATDNVYNNTWGNIRKSAGLHGYDQWDDYRLDRELSNMVAEGRYSIDEIMLAMLNREGPIFEEAQSRVERTLAVQGIYSMLGIPVSAYPEGENSLRSLYDEFDKAWNMYDAGDAQALNRFFEENPEFEARLALWDEPEERMRKFITDRIWDTYGNLPSVNKNIARQGMPGFADLFLNKETANRNNIPIQTLATWLKMMGGDTPNGLGDSALPLAFVPPDVANQVQVFYDNRNYQFPNWFDLQDQYNSLEHNPERENFLAAHPELQAYWDWADQQLPNWRDLTATFFETSDTSERSLYLDQHPELKAMWEKGNELFPNHSELAQQYRFVPDYMKSNFLRAHPELLAYWNWRDEYLPQWDAYYDTYFNLNDTSARDLFLQEHPELQQFFDAKDETFPDIGDLTRVYATLPGNDVRKGFLSTNPELKAYWDWRNQFLLRNPNLAPYIDDDFQPNYGSVEELQQLQEGGPNFTWAEWQFQISTPLQELLQDYYNGQEPLPDAAVEELEELAGGMGLSIDDLLFRIGAAYQQPVP